MICPECKSGKVDDGTSHGSTYDFFCRNCGNRFDDIGDDADSIEGILPDDDSRL